VPAQRLARPHLSRLQLDLKLHLLESILPSNDEHLKRSIQEVLELPGKRIGIFGLPSRKIPTTCARPGDYYH